ncbi:hypothetical protein JCM10908_002434 [Rhodotorula pacifica]|uniref:uncharacterized protein n=1 Tax=Rhodotorula pacifica TaxID=1495444 RepID=UPI00317F9B81
MTCDDETSQSHKSSPSPGPSLAGESARIRGPPPASWKWAPPHFQLDFDALPPLPSVRDGNLARQARTTKNYLGALGGRLSHFSYEDELGSYRRLEWLGDTVLHRCYALRLFHLFPEAGSGLLSILQGELAANNTHAHLAWAYSLDLTMLEPPDPSKPKAAWRPLRQVQNIVADLLEAHVGALAQEGREAEVESWVHALFARNHDRLSHRVATLLAQARETQSQSRAQVRKRSKDEAFEGGAEFGTLIALFCPSAEPDRVALCLNGLDARMKRRRFSYLDECPSTGAGSDEDKPFYDDRSDGNGGWHSHFLLADATVGCGSSRKLSDSRTAAVEDFFRLLRVQPDLWAHLERFMARDSATRPSAEAPA